MSRPGPAVGALVGALLAAPLAALMFAVQRALGAPFPPFDAFDLLARTLPGPVVTFGIDRLVDVILLLNLGAVDDVAKLAEQALALVLFLGLGAALGAAAFAVLRGEGVRSTVLRTTLLGAAWGLVAFLIAGRVAEEGAPRPLPTALWLLLVFGAWGAALGGSRDRLAALAPTPPADGAPAPEAQVERLDRRRFLLRLGGATAVVTVAGAGLGALLRSTRPEVAASQAGDPASATPWSERNPLPNADAEVAPAPGTRAELTPVPEHYRIDINTVPPRVDGASWQLRFDGLVDTPLDFSLEELQSFPSRDEFITLACISNRLGGDLIGTTRWTGVSLRRLLPHVGLLPDATHLRISSSDGFYEVVSIATALADDRVMLAYAWDGLPLTRAHGYPLRVYVPDVYGMKQPKWIERIEAVDGWEEGYWVARSWDDEAQIRTTSVIDTVAVDEAFEDDEGDMRVPVGGIAHAGARGISRVEVRVDDGAWQAARLREPLSPLTWVLWRFDWPLQEGEHTFTVRCVDGEGNPQIEERNPVRPSGATGLLQETVRV